MTGLPDLLTPDNVRALMSNGVMTTQTIRKACADGSIPAIKIGRRWFIPKERFFDFLNGKEGEKIVGA